MTTVNHDSWNIVMRVIIFFAERTFVFIEELGDELIDFFAK